MSEETYLTAGELADRWGVSRVTIHNWARRDYGPKPIQKGLRKTYYALSEVEKFEQENKGLLLIK